MIVIRGIDLHEKTSKYSIMAICGFALLVFMVYVIWKNWLLFGLLASYVHSENFDWRLKKISVKAFCKSHDILGYTELILYSNCWTKGKIWECDGIECSGNCES
jgi:hypothetical protein